MTFSVELPGGRGQGGALGIACDYGRQELESRGPPGWDLERSQGSLVFKDLPSPVPT